MIYIASNKDTGSVECVWNNPIDPNIPNEFVETDLQSVPKDIPMFLSPQKKIVGLNLLAGADNEFLVYAEDMTSGEKLVYKDSIDVLLERNSEEIQSMRDIELNGGFSFKITVAESGFYNLIIVHHNHRAIQREFYFERSN